MIYERAFVFGQAVSLFTMWKGEPNTFFWLCKHHKTERSTGFSMTSANICCKINVSCENRGKNGLLRNKAWGSVNLSDQENLLRNLCIWKSLKNHDFASHDWYFKSQWNVQLKLFQLVQAFGISEDSFIFADLLHSLPFLPAYLSTEGGTFMHCFSHCKSLF